jgi:hypothetical protein
MVIGLEDKLGNRRRIPNTLNRHCPTRAGLLFQQLALIDTAHCRELRLITLTWVNKDNCDPIVSQVCVRRVRVIHKRRKEREEHERHYAQLSMSESRISPMTAVESCPCNSVNWSAK